MANLLPLYWPISLIAYSSLSNLARRCWAIIAPLEKNKSYPPTFSSMALMSFHGVLAHTSPQRIDKEYCIFHIKSTN